MRPSYQGWLSFNDVLLGITAMDVEKYRREFVCRVVDARGDKTQVEIVRLLDIPLPTYKSYERRASAMGLGTYMNGGIILGAGHSRSGK